ncbi:type I toxin-antitoxin system Fst family toxin [Aerococcus sp. UMB1112A]|nr:MULTISPECIES: type I toxin-antitoxin system Fst family toxin [unclassified Aerococcus]KAB0645249.1 type I toxin-antitoxin system Fst family toxin [Aerococcus sanguinicola]MDK6805111.1 type I toxin-antitoxin system Fst family toxin [Aerococcus sp. UMB7834]MDK6856385.1 type I toxin-antitoxin system Fst family toxin [Aerococcus sp. UMB7533]MDK8503305.1 type I toxin-antitoxin system Fst family toxin [Aerococcus sp. UMB1112A]
MQNDFLMLVIVPIFVGIVIELFSWWLNKKQ